MHSLRFRYVLFIGLLPLGCSLALAFSKTLTSYLLLTVVGACGGIFLAHYLYNLHMNHIKYALEQFSLITNGNFMPTPPKDSLFKEDLELLKKLDESSLEIRMTVNNLCKEIDSMSSGNIPSHISTPLRGDYKQIKKSLNNLCVSLKTDKVKFDRKTKKLEDNAKNTYICSQRVHKAYTEQLKVAKDMLRCLALTQDSFNLCKNYSKTLDQKAEKEKETLKTIDEISDSQLQLPDIYHKINHKVENLCHLVKQISDLNNNLALITAVGASGKDTSANYSSLVAKQSHTLAIKNMYVQKEITSLKQMLATTFAKNEAACNSLTVSTLDLKELSESKNNLLSQLLEQTSICSKETDNCAANALSLIKSLESNSKQTQTDIVHVSEGISSIATEIKETAPYLLKPQSISTQSNLLNWVEETDQ